MLSYAIDNNFQKIEQKLILLLIQAYLYLFAKKIILTLNYFEKFTFYWLASK